MSSGFSSVRETSSLPFSWVQNEAPRASFIPIVDHLTVAAKAGGIIWISDVMTPQRGCKPTAAHACEPVQLELTAKGLLYEVGGASGCAIPAHGSLMLFSAVGGSIGYETYGHFVRHTAAQLVCAAYRYGCGKSRLHLHDNAKVVLQGTGVPRNARVYRGYDLAAASRLQRSRPAARAPRRRD